MACSTSVNKFSSINILSFIEILKIQRIFYACAFFISYYNVASFVFHYQKLNVACISNNMLYQQHVEPVQ